MSFAVTLGLSLAAPTPLPARSAPALPAAVDLTLPGGSLRLPADNNRSAALPDRKQVLIQPTDSGWPQIWPAAVKSYLFAIVSVPRGALQVNRTFGVLGGSQSDARDTDIVLRGRGYLPQPAQAGAFVLRLGSSVAASPPLDEEAALIVAQKDGAGGNRLRIDWYSLRDGTKHAGSSFSSTNKVQPGARGRFIVGAPGLNDISSPYQDGDGEAWPGEIQAVGFVTGDVPDATWAAIALGQPLETALAGVSVPWVREFDGTPASLSAPAWAAADATLPMIIDGRQRLEPGSDIRAQSQTDFLIPDAIPEGHVWGVTATGGDATVTLSGRAAGRSGTVQAQLVYADTGAVAQDWTDVAPVGAVWSGSFSAPLTGAGWCIVRYRTTGEPDLISTMRNRVGVGYKLLALGQSQAGIWHRSSERGDTLSGGLEISASRALARAQNDGPAPPSLSWIGTDPQDGLAAFVTQLRSYTSAPVQIILDAMEGSGPDEMMDDRDTRRNWSDLQAQLDRFGNDVTVVAMNWITQGWETWGTAGETLQALTLGTGPAWDALVADNGGSTAGLHHLDAALRPGWAFALSPATRASDSDYQPTRSAQIRFANAAGIAVGPPVSDYEIVAGGGPHPDNAFEGNRRFGMRLAEAVARALGFSTSENPHFTGAAWGATQAEIVLSVALPNGGSLTSPAPAALSSFEVGDGPGGAYSGSGFTAAITGNTITLTKDTGTWAAGSRVQYLPGGAQRAGGDAVTEAAIIAGMLYETWPGDTLGTGLPVSGSRVAGQWVPGFEAVLQP